jgi:hypothetical protein
LSNTVLFGADYANCDTVGRIALSSWYNHAFGLGWYHIANTNVFQTGPGHRMRQWARPERPPRWHERGAGRLRRPHGQRQPTDTRLTPDVLDGGLKGLTLDLK